MFKTIQVIKYYDTGDYVCHLIQMLYNYVYYFFFSKEGTHRLRESILHYREILINSQAVSPIAVALA